MIDVVLETRLESSDEGRLRVLAPRVGWWSDLPRPGTLVGPGSPVGELWQLHRKVLLRLPDGAAGRIVSLDDRLRTAPVEYGQLLFELEPLRSGAGPADVEAGVGGIGVGAGSGLAAGQHAIVAPTDGIFYQRPSPDAPPFVRVGQRIRSGQAVGLVEVMKTFNQILYGGPGLPEEAEVEEIRCADSEEVSVGDVLIVLR